MTTLRQITPEEAERLAGECDYLVCIEWSDPLMFPDNAVAKCIACDKRLQHRPDAPSKPACICVVCATGLSKAN